MRLDRAPAALSAMVASFLMMGAPRAALAEVRVERSADADSCPDTQSFVERVAEDGAEPEAYPSTAEVTVRFERTTDGYRSSVRVADGDPRSLVDRGPDCAGLAEATVLAVKLALDLDATRRRAHESAISAPQPITPLPAAVPAPQPDSERGGTVLGELSVSGTVAVGLVSPVAAGVRAGAAVTLDDHERWSLGLTGIVLPAHTIDVGQNAVDVSVQGGGVEGCGRTRAGRSTLLGICGRFEALRLAGESRGFDWTEQQARVSITGSLLARARARVAGPVAVVVELGAMLPFVRQRFTIDTVGLVYDPPPVAGAAGIGIAVDFE